MKNLFSLFLLSLHPRLRFPPLNIVYFASYESISCAWKAFCPSLPSSSLSPPFTVYICPATNLVPVAISHLCRSPSHLLFSPIAYTVHLLSFLVTSPHK